MTHATRLAPLLIARDALGAIDFYIQALGAVELVRYMNEPLGILSHADLALGDLVFSVTEELPDFNSDAPPSLGGSPVVLQLRVDDLRATYERMLEAGAETVFPPGEFCGERMARVRDPYGHLWLLHELIEELSTAEIRARRNALFRAMANTPHPE